MDDASERHPEVPYSPVLIDATYAGLISGAADAPLVIPALNRDGDCLSDLVMPMFGSIAGAESVLLAFDDDYDPRAVMAEAPHGTAPALLGKDIANPMAMILAAAAVLHYAWTLARGRDTASRAIYESVLEAVLPAFARRTSAATQPPPSSRTRSSAGCARRSTSGPRSRVEAWHRRGVAGAVKTPAQRFAFWLSWWAIAYGLWVLFVFKTEPAELVAGGDRGGVRGHRRGARPLARLRTVRPGPRLVPRAAACPEGGRGRHVAHRCSCWSGISCAASR